MNENKLFDFNNISYPKFPAQIKARYIFENELVQIPDSEFFLNVDAGQWLIHDDENKNVFTMSFDQFLDIYLASDKKSQRYCEFIADTKNNDYKIPIEDPSIVLYEEIFGDLIEKPAPIKNKWKLVWDLICNKKIYITRYF